MFKKIFISLVYIITIVISIFVMFEGVKTHNLILSFCGLSYSFQLGWSKKLLNSNKANDLKKTMEHWKIIPSLILVGVSLFLAIFATNIIQYNISPYIVGVIALMLSFICGYNVRIS